MSAKQDTCNIKGMMRVRNYQNRSRPLLKDIKQIVFLLLLLLLPIERVLVLNVNGFTLRPVYFVMVLCILLCIRNLRFPPGIVAFALLFGIVVWISLEFSLDPQISMPYSLWAAFTVVFSITAVAFIRNNPYYVELLIQYYLYSASFWSLIAITQWFLALKYTFLAYSFLGNYPRVHALMLEPSYLATFLIFPFVLSLTKKRYSYATLIGSALVFSTSRTGVLASLFVLAILIMIKLVSGKAGKLKNIVSLIILSLVSVLAIAYSSTAYTFLSTLTKFTSSGLLLEDTSSAIPRFSSWDDAYHLFLSYPLTGVGLGGYGYALIENNLVNLGDIGNHGARSLKTTNLFLEVSAEMGIVGLLLLFLWISMPIWNLRHCPFSSLGFAVMLGFIGLLLTFPFIQTWWRPYLWLPWVLGVGYVCRR